METSAMATNMVLQFPMNPIQAQDGVGLFLPLSFLLFWALKHNPLK
jgi:hypothetical protein